MLRRLLLGMGAGSPSTDRALLIRDLEILEPSPGSGIGLASKVTGRANAIGGPA